MKATTGQSREEKSLKYFHREAGAVGVAEAGNAYQSASLVAAGAGGQGVGVLSGLTSLVTFFLYLRVPSAIRLLGSPKRTVVALSFLDTLSWLPLLVVLLFAGRVSTSLLIVLWIVNLVPGMMLGPIRMAWMVSLTSADKRGKYLGLRLSINTASYLVFFYTMAYLLRLFSGEHVFTGFAIVFSVAFAATAFSFFMYTRISKPTQTVPEDSSFGFAAFLQEIHRKNLGRFILYISLFGFTVYLAAPFFAVYMLNELRFDYITFAIVMSAALVARIVAMPIWGSYADRLGNLKLIRIASFSIPFVPLLWLVSPNVFYLVLVQLFSGVVWAGFDLCAPNFIYQSASPQRRLQYILFHKSLSSAAMALGSLTAVLLFNHLNPILGSQVLALFLLSGILCFVVTIAILPRIRELPRNNQTCLEKPVIVPTMGSAFVLNSGLLHRPEQWSHFTSPSAVASRAAGGMADPTTRRVSLLYRPKEWRWFSKPLALAPVTVDASAGAAATGGLFYRPREWQFFVGRR